MIPERCCFSNLSRACEGRVEGKQVKRWRQRTVNHLKLAQCGFQCFLQILFQLSQLSPLPQQQVISTISLLQRGRPVRASVYSSELGAGLTRSDTGGNKDLMLYVCEASRQVFALEILKMILRCRAENTSPHLSIFNTKVDRRISAFEVLCKLAVSVVDGLLVLPSELFWLMVRLVLRLRSIFSRCPRSLSSLTPSSVTLPACLRSWTSTSRTLRM